MRNLQLPSHEKRRTKLSRAAEIQVRRVRANEAVTAKANRRENKVSGAGVFWAAKKATASQLGLAQRAPGTEGPGRQRPQRNPGLKTHPRAQARQRLQRTPDDLAPGQNSCPPFPLFFLHYTHAWPAVDRVCVYQKIPVGDVEMHIVILRDPEYPLLPWLMQSYTGNLDSSKKCFNNRLRTCRMTIQCTFGRLKARWHCLYGRLGLNEENILMVIATYCMFHNICEVKGEKFTPAWKWIWLILSS
ncbi:uncharacterized protein LOC117872734 [Trachemys scripta elegans]|uniref:uncharacterized protein LOC117872734 n=1 Tax=Trachemys scripta elegans TaxID=31138 RepID=UPI0015520722|nr:uncharacterized protein LOC117872734 [Trachemys scripta elegans]